MDHHPAHDGGACPVHAGRLVHVGRQEPLLVAEERARRRPFLVDDHAVLGGANLTLQLQRCSASMLMMLISPPEHALSTLAHIIYKDGKSPLSNDEAVLIVTDRQVALLACSS